MVIPIVLWCFLVLGMAITASVSVWFSFKRPRLTAMLAMLLTAMLVVPTGPGHPAMEPVSGNQSFSVLLQINNVGCETCYHS